MNTNAIKYILIFFISGLFLSNCSKDDDKDENNIPSTVDKNLMLKLVNNLRQSSCDCGENSMPATNTLKWNSKLEAAAYSHALDMDENQYFNHTSLDGRTPGDRIKAQGYFYRTYGENIAATSGKEEYVFNMWLNSEGHCKNMMHNQFTEIGIACSGRYWVMVLGTPQ